VNWEQVLFQDELPSRKQRGIKPLSAYWRIEIKHLFLFLNAHVKNPMNLAFIKMMMTVSLTVLTLLVTGQIYLSNDGKATFESDAPLEFITATSKQLSGAINLTDNMFAFRLANKSFIGFNSPLQQEHFYENYIEADKYTYSSFQGKIIENIDLESGESQQVRAKGTLSIHGVEQERIIKASIIVTGERIKVNSRFEVLLEDHDIRIPNVVHKKIAETVDVNVETELILKTDQ
jgi:hypothetical protein